jgi:hypothetical protein
VPTQTLPDHLAVEISTASATGWIKVPHRRCQEVSRSVKDILCQLAKGTRRVESDLLRSFLGKVSSIGGACDQARFRLRALHDRHELWKPLSILDRAALRDLRWWSDFHYSSSVNGVPLWSSPPTRAIWTDASSELGYGSILQVPHVVRKAFGAWWSLPEKQKRLYHEGARHRPEKHFAFHRRFAWTHGVSLRRQPIGRGDHQEPHVFFFIVNERVVSSDGLTNGTSRHSLGTSVDPYRAQSGRRLFKTDPPRHVGVVALRSTHAHAARATPPLNTGERQSSKLRYGVIPCVTIFGRKREK